jgi:hypothetical protein
VDYCLAGETQCFKETYPTGTFSTTSPTPLHKPKNSLYQRQSGLNFSAGVVEVLPSLLLLKLTRRRRAVTVGAGRMQ